MIALLLSVALSLKSFDDYRYIVLPEGSPKPNCVGIGCGKNLDYRLPRQEDPLFLCEALEERCAYVRGRTIDNSTYDNYYPFGLIPSVYEFSYVAGLYDGCFRVKGISIPDDFFLKPFSGYPDRVVDTGLASDWFNAVFYNRWPSDVAKYLFPNATPPISLSYIENMKWRNGEIVADIGRTALYDAGYVTNVYADIEANTDLIRRWKLRGGPVRDTRRTIYQYPSYSVFSGYDFDHNTWIEQKIQTDDTETATDIPFNLKERQYVFSTSVSKVALSAFRNGNRVATKVYSYVNVYATDTVDSYFKMEIDIPYEYDLGPIKNAYAVCLFDGMGTNGMEGFSKVLLVPVTLTSAGERTYKVNQSMSSIFGSCMNLVGSPALALTNSSLIERATENPEPPTSPSPYFAGRDHIQTASNNGSGSVSLYVDSVITVSTPTSLHATVLQ